MQFNNKNYTRGKLAKENGERFENQIIKTMLRDGIAFIKIPSSCKWIGKRVVAMKSPFDFVAGHNSKTILFDAKSTEGKTFTYSKIKTHQLNALMNFRIKKIVSGYVVYFSEIKQVVFFDSMILKKVKPRQSLSFEDGFCLGRIDNFSLLKLMPSELAIHPQF